jgi:Uma2 family endonuclease
MRAELLMSTAQQRELVSSASVVGLTLDQYVRMIKEGILPEGEPIELLDGFLVRKDRAKAGDDPMTVGFEHVWAVQNLTRVLAEAERTGCHVRLQQPIALPPDGAPEPDGAIARGSIDDYRNRYPSARDLPCVIEVADSSRYHDRLTKKRIYAKGGIAQYVIINLVDRVVEISEEPVPGGERYAREAVFRPGDTVQFSTGESGTINLDVSRLLP